MPNSNGQAITGFQQRGVPADLIAPFAPFRPAGSGGPGIDRALQIYLPEIFPIPAATEFNTLLTKATVAAETNTDFGILIDVPDNNIAIIRGVSLFITNMLTTTQITWTLLTNNGPVGGYSNLFIFPRTAPFVSNAFDSFIRVDNGQIVRAQFTNPATDGGSYTLGIAVSGWWWPKTLGDLWMRTGGQQITPNTDAG
jgi:hypothetical protein